MDAGHRRKPYSISVPLRSACARLIERVKFWILVPLGLGFRIARGVLFPVCLRALALHSRPRSFVRCVSLREWAFVHISLTFSIYFLLIERWNRGGATRPARLRECESVGNRLRFSMLAMHLLWSEAIIQNTYVLYRERCADGARAEGL